MSNDKVAATFHPVEQWYSISVGGPMAPTSLIVHAACGAVIADRRRHEQVCTAPALQPAESEIGKVRDWFNGRGQHA